MKVQVKKTLHCKFGISLAPNKVYEGVHKNDGRVAVHYSEVVRVLVEKKDLIFI